MSKLKCGIVGLPNVGKSTTFNAITRTSNARVGNYPFCTIEPNSATVPVEDHRLDLIAKVAKAARAVPVSMCCVDIAGLVRGASKGAGKGSQFLRDIKDVDAIIHIARSFVDPDVLHVEEVCDPLSDIKSVEIELVLFDLESLEKMKKKPPAVQEAIKVLERGENLRQLSDALYKELVQYNLLSMKPVVYAINTTTDEDKEIPSDLASFLADKQWMTFCALHELEASQWRDEERKEYREVFGELGVTRMMSAVRESLRLTSYFTAGVKEARAWNIPVGATFPQAAGVIHSDFERGFIAAETICWKKFVEFGGWDGGREHVVKVLNKTSTVSEGLVCNFLIGR